MGSLRQEHTAWISPGQNGWLSERSGKWYGNLSIYVPTYDERLRERRHVRFLLACKVATRIQVAQRMLTTEVEKIKVSGRSRYRRFEREGHILMISGRQKGWLSQRSGKWYGNVSVCFVAPETNLIVRKRIQFLLSSETGTPELKLKRALDMRVAGLKQTGWIAA